MLYLLSLLNILNYLDRYLLAAVLPAVQSEFSLSHQQGGQLQSAFVIGYVVCAPLFGALGDRLSRPRLMGFGALLWSIATLASGMAPSYLTLMISRVAIGVGEASFVTTAPGFIKDRLNNPAQLNRALGIFFAAIPVGAALGYMLGGALVGSVGWRSAFFVAGFPGIVLAGVIALRAETPQREVVAVDRAESAFKKTMTLCKIPSLRIGVIGYTLNSFALSGVATFIVPYGVFRGFDAGEVGKIFGLILVCAGVLGTSLGGKLGARAAARDTETLTASFSLIAWLSVAATPFFAFAFFTESTILFYLTCFIGEVLVFAVVAPINALLVSEAPPHMVAFSQGVIVLCLNLFGAFLSPLVIGAVADRLNLGWSMQIAVLAVAASGIAWWFGINLKKSRVV